MSDEEFRKTYLQPDNHPPIFPRSTILASSNGVGGGKQDDEDEPSYFSVLVENHGSVHAISSLVRVVNRACLKFLFF